MKKLEEFFKKIHDPKSKIPEYASIIIKPGKKVLDVKIKKEVENILRVIAHEENQSGWFLHSVHIPLKNLGLYSQIFMSILVLQYVHRGINWRRKRGGGR